MIAARSVRLLSFIALIFLLQPVFKLAASEGIPNGAKILFLDGIVNGKVLVPSAYGDTVRLERPMSLTLERESFLCFDLYCCGYQRLRIYACEKEDSTKSILLTRFNTNGPDRFNIALDGNFHNFHWRKRNYGALEAGDKIVRLVFEFTMRDDSPGSIKLGGIKVYSLNEKTHRKHAEKVLAEAKKEVAEIPDYSEPDRNRLDELLDSANFMLGNPSLLSTDIRTITQEIEVITEKAKRINNYYSPARDALGQEKIDYCVGLESSLRRVTHANRLFKFQGRVPAEPQISLARNEYEAFQLVVLPFDSFLRDVRVTCSDLEGPSGKIAAGNISVGLPGLVQTQLSPHSNGTDLGWVPDPIMPLRPGDSFSLGLEEALALWIEIHAPFGTAPGVYQGTITIEPENTHPTVVPLQVTVWDYEIPLRGVFRTQGHFSIERLEQFYHRTVDSEWLKEWYDFCLDYRFDPVGQYSNYLTPRADLIPFCLEQGLNTIIIGELTNPEKFDPGALDSVYNLVKENDWLEYSYAYIGDETENFPLMRDRANFIHTRCPGVKVMIGGSIPRPELVGYIDVWDPIMEPHGVYGFDAQACREALSRGEEVLWYVCVGPDPPYPNVQLEDPLVDCRSLFWMTYKYDIMGYEYWAYLYWEKNLKPAGEPRWPRVEWNSYAFDHSNGDGLLCYPGPDGLPVPSMRLAVNRDGIEDWEALWIMEDLARTVKELRLDKDKQVAEMVSRAQALADIPDEVVRDLTHYTKEPQTILRHRAMVSELIIGLQEKIGKERAEQYRLRHRNERETEDQEALWRNIERARRESK